MTQSNTARADARAYLKGRGCRLVSVDRGQGYQLRKDATVVCKLRYDGGKLTVTEGTLPPKNTPGGKRAGSGVKRVPRSSLSMTTGSKEQLDIIFNGLGVQVANQDRRLANGPAAEGMRQIADGRLRVFRASDIDRISQQCSDEGLSDSYIRGCLERMLRRDE